MLVTRCFRESAIAERSRGVRVSPAEREHATVVKAAAVAAMTMHRVKGVIMMSSTPKTNLRGKKACPACWKSLSLDGDKQTARSAIIEGK